jgi:uncharacterized protein (DUF4415 family)
MKEKLTGVSSAKRYKARKTFATRSDAQVRRGIERDPEARPTDARFWKTAHVVLPTANQTVTIRLDADLLTWLRKEKGYQTRINAVLRTYMESRAATET